MTRLVLPALLFLSLAAEGKTFKNSYVSFDVPDNWTCIQEGVAWTCTPQGAVESKEAVIVVAAKVAGPEDNLPAFLNFLKQPKKIPTKVGTPMPSAVMYAQMRQLGGGNWVQAQHLGSEIQEFYTLYLATVKDQLAILISFSSERNQYTKYNPIFDKAIKSLKIIANQQLLFPKAQSTGSGDVIGIQVPNNKDYNKPIQAEDMMPPPERKPASMRFYFVLMALGLAISVGAYIFTTRRKKISRSKSSKPRVK